MTVYRLSEKDKMSVYKLIANVTGHRVEDLDTDMYLESDLGLDSIKMITLMNELIKLIPQEQVEDFMSKNPIQVLMSLQTIHDIIDIMVKWKAEQHATNGLSSSISSVIEINDSDDKHKKIDEPNIYDEQTIASIFSVISNVTGHNVADLDVGLYLESDLGIDSIKMITLMNELMKLIPQGQLQDFTEKHPVQFLMNLQTIGDIACIFTKWKGELSTSVPLNHNSGYTNSEKVDTLEMIHAQYPFLISYFAVSTITISSGVKVKGSLDTNLLKQAWQELVGRHPILQSVFQVQQGAESFKEYCLNIVKEIELPEIPVLDLRHLAVDMQKKAIKHHFETSLNKKINIFQWPLHFVEVIRTRDEEYEIVLSINHTISDGIGNQQIIRELLELYSAKVHHTPSGLTESISASEYNRIVSQMNEWVDEIEQKRLEQFLNHQGREQYFFNPYQVGKEAMTKPFAGVTTKTQKFWLDEELTTSLMTCAKLLETSLFTLLLSAYIKTVKQYDVENKNLILNIPTSGKVYPNVDATGVLGAFAQNLALTFDYTHTDWKTFVNKIDTEMKRNVTSGIDRAQTHKAAKEAKEYIQLQDGKLSDTVAQFVRSTLKSNLYFSFIGNTNLKKNYGGLEVYDYEAYTCTNYRAIDNVMELFHGKIMITSNYDGDFFNESFIREYIDAFIYNIKDLVAYAQSIHQNIRQPIIINEDAEVKGAVCNIVEEVCARPILLGDMDKDLDVVFGMDSLQRIRVITRIEKEFGNCDQEKIFGCRTIREMVSIISEKKGRQLVESVEVPYFHIMEQCKQTPQAIAIEYGDEKVTYSELDHLSNRLAHCLREKGVKRGDLIGIMTNPGPYMLIGMLGILKSGAAYVPLDPSYPLNRIHYILNHAKVEILLSEQAFKTQISQLLQKQTLMDIVVYIDPWETDVQMSLQQIEKETWMSYSHQEIERINHPDDIMTVLYTSGSTGHPKGVVLQHRGYMNRLNWHQDIFKLKLGERVAQKTSCCFDVSIWELFWPLMFGGTVCPVHKDVVRNPWRLARWIIETRISVMHFVPSLFGEFIHSIEDKAYHFPNLRWLIFSGEALPASVIKKWLQTYGESTGLANLYGPTEASIDVTYHIIEGNQILDGSENSILIGKPLNNVHVKILDEDMREVPKGTIGELWIGGIQLAKGYLNNPSKTKEAFKMNLFSEIPGDYLYRTGDLVKMRPDGNLEYHGRIDNQVKVRGFRVELGEIEAVIHSHSSVKEVGVVTLDSPEEHKQLIACVVGNCLEEQELKRFIGQKLPYYMIPHRIEFLSSLPKNHNGKLDRKVMLSILQTKKKEMRQDVSSVVTETAIVTKDDVIPLSPAQQWLINYFEHPYRWTGYTRFLYKQDIDITTFNKALNILVNRHDALRSVVTKENGGWVQRILPQGISISAETYDGTQMDENERERSLKNLIDEVIQTFEIGEWPLLRVIIMKVSKSIYDITVVGHHLISDVITNQLLFKEMWQIYGQLLSSNEEVKLPTVKSYKEFVLLVEEKKKENLVEYVEYWKGQFPMHEHSFYIPADLNLGTNDEQSTCMESFLIEKSATAILLGKAKDYFKSNVYSMLLAPLYKMLSSLYNQSKVVVSHRTHGRNVENQQIFFDTPGNFAINYPLSITINKEDTWLEVVHNIKNNMNEVPMGGISYDLVAPYLPSYMYPDTKLTPIRANYLGNRDMPDFKVFEFSKGNTDRRFSMPGQKRISMIEFFFSIVEGKLQVCIEYSKNLYHSSTIRKLGEEYMKQLDMMLATIDTGTKVNQTPMVMSNSSGEIRLLADKVAIVTGGGRGIGRAIAISMAQEGASVAIVSRTEHQLDETACEIRKLGIEPLVIPGDIGEWNDVQHIVKTVSKQFGKIDIVVNNAGITKVGSVTDVTSEEWKEIIRVNVFGTYHMCRATIPYLIEQKCGKIINIGSDSSFIGYPFMSAYAASKHGVLGLTKSLAEEMKPYNIQVNAVCPSLVNTDMAPKAFKNKAIPPEQVAETVKFLASAQSDCITGESIRVYGKQDMYWFGSEQIPMLKAILNK
ncbi:amino acid adenylation domain-containing protein [Bacillus cytotoxicus]|uniref:amino acid adenylation domain-containing protein n=1 Tax=Bacillus cytotoxicus TaxID=580165 RepID=UPI0035CA52BD